MRKLFEETVELTKIRNKGLALHLAKCVEEFGELAQSINKTLGVKEWENIDTAKNIRENVLEESADTFQCLISIMSDYDITFDELKSALAKKNKKWNKKYIENQKLI